MTRDLMVFGEDWGGLPSSTQYLMAQLAKSRKVLWINSIGLRQPTCSLRDLKRVLHKLCSGIEDTKSTLPANTFRVLKAKTIPAPRTPIARAVASKLLALQIKPLMLRMDLHKPIFWTSLATAVDVKQYFKALPMVYYCGDDFSSLPGVDHETIAQHEQALVVAADLIITASATLAAKFPRHKTQILPHGVDFELFSQPAKRATDLPNNGKRTAGFYGSIEAWLDLRLLEEVAKALPQWNFVFIGKTKINTQTLQALSNVYFLGAKPHGLLPQYSQHWDVSLLPFKPCAQIEACNPLKLREYLATGKPIISTVFPAMQAYQHIIPVTDAPTMIQALSNLPRDSSRVKTHQNDLSTASWQTRAATLSGWLNAL